MFKLISISAFVVMAIMVSGCAQKPAPKYKSKVVKAKVDNNINTTYVTFSHKPTFTLQKTAMLSVPLIDKDNNADMLASVNYSIVGINDYQELYVRYQLRSIDNQDTATQIYDITKTKAVVSSSKYDPYEIMMENGKLFRAHTFDKVPYMEYKDKNGKQLSMQKLPANVMNNYFLFKKNIVMVTPGNIYIYSVDDLKIAPSVFHTKVLDNKTQWDYKFTESNKGDIYLSLGKNSLEKVALLDTYSLTVKWKKNINGCASANVIVFDNKLACSEKNRLNVYDLQNDKLLLKVNTDNNLRHDQLVYDQNSHMLVQTAVKHSGAYNGELVLVDIKNKIAKKIKLPSYGSSYRENAIFVSNVLDGYIQLGVVPNQVSKKSPLIYVDLDSLYANTLDDITDKYPKYPVQAVTNQKKQFLLPINENSYDGKGDALVVNRFEIIKLGEN